MIEYKIGCRLAGGDLRKVEGIIEKNVLEDFKVIVYSLQGEKK